MKIKPLYIYITIFVVVIGGIIIIDSSEEATDNQTQSKQQGEMPNDDVHKNLGDAPGSGNVSKEFREKMDNLETQYKSNPNDTANAKEYARLLAAAHKPEEAVNVYNSILSNSPNRIDLRLELATVYYNMQQYQSAKNEIEIVLNDRPDSPDVLYNLGAIEATLGNKDKAKEIWEKVTKEYSESNASELARNALQSLQ